MLPFLNRSPVTHECFVGNLKLMMNRIYFFQFLKNVLSLSSQHTLLASLKQPNT